MPAPSTIVTLIDADEDEIPIRLPGPFDGTERSTNYASDLAIIELKRMEADGTAWPKWPVKVDTIEEV